MNLTSLSALHALSLQAYYARPLLVSGGSLGGGVVASKRSFILKTGKRSKSLKSRSNRRKAKRLFRA